jgi:Ras-related protein Rab-5C
MKPRSSVAFSVFAKTNFKLIVVGDRNAGKTSLILRYVKGTFCKTHSNNQGIEFYSKLVSIDMDEAALQLWDTVPHPKIQAGTEHFKSVTKSFYQQASCVIITYCHPSEVRTVIESYLLDINEYAQNAVQIVVVRTKIDEEPL